VANKTHFPKFATVKGGVTVNLDLTKYTDRLNKAQFVLDNRIMTDMVPYMPMVTGNFIQLTRARSAALAGTGTVCAAAHPFGRFLYYGKVMVDEVTGSPWARKGTEKIVTDRPLNYSNPKATPEWFETAKKENLKEWIDDVEGELIGRK